MDTVNTRGKEHLGYQETPMGNVVVQCISNCDTHLIKAEEPLQSSHTGWPRIRAFAAIALGAIGTAAEEARLLYLSFFFLLLNVMAIHLGVKILLVSWNRNMKQLSLTKLL